MDSTMHLTLTSLPLLQGVSATDFAQILDQTNYKYIECEKGELLMERGAACQHLTFLIEGTLQVDTQYDGHYSFTEYISSPGPIEPEILYGIRRQYASTYITASDCRLLKIPKSDVNRMIGHIEVFRLNYLNLLSTLAVRRLDTTRPSRTAGLRERIVHFLTIHATQPFGPKRFRIRKSDLGEYVDASRVAVSAVLHQMQDEGLLTCERGYIEIPNMEKLMIW